MNIALIGPKGAGKTTVARMLFSGYGYTRISFADPIKEMLKAMGVPHDNLHDPDLKEKPMPDWFGVTPRHMMQTLGTEWGRDLIHPEIWAHAWALKAKASPLPVVVDDMRFPNEATIFRPGKIIYVKRSNIKTSDPHASEGLYDQIKWDAILPNDGDLAELRLTLSVIMDALRDE